MQYRKFGQTEEITSILGLGCMRFPCIDNKVDIKKTNEIINYAIDNGVNYFDTAYVYHDEKSEEILGNALVGKRDKIKIATKSPCWLLKNENDFDMFLDTQLKRLKTNYIDFYLLHALDNESWNEKVLKFNLLNKMTKAKKDGKIKHIGFSFHDNFDCFKKIIDSFSWDFCQIQLNYIDVYNQATLDGLYYAQSKNIAVVIMEPLRGGKLATPPKRVVDALPKGKPVVQTALDFLWNQSGVKVLLSGMSSLSQLKQNIEYANLAKENSISKEDLKKYDNARKIYESTAMVPCTKCAYCMPCPFGVDIVKVYEAYNMTALSNPKKVSDFYDSIDGKADLCRKCKRCEKLCPQKIKTSELMQVIQQKFLKNDEV